jgi:isocitrate lyase
MWTTGRQGICSKRRLYAKINTCCYAFLVLAAEDSVIVARTGSMGAGLIRTIAVTCKSDDVGNLYNSFHNVEEATLGACWT